MKATNLLTQQHKQVAALFQKFERTNDRGVQNALFDQIGARLAAHDAIERELFYPACKEALGEEDATLGEAVVEHGVIEFSIYKADIADPDDLKHCVKVLADVVEHHVEEEQDELFPKVEEAMSAALLEELGARMEARYAEALEEDFREAVRANLDQVMAGAIETEPEAEGTAAPKAKKTAAKKTSAAKEAAPPARRAASSTPSAGKANGSSPRRSGARA